MKYLNKKQKIIIICIVLILLIVLYYTNVINKKELIEVEKNLEIIANEENKQTVENIPNIKIHICGAVKQEGIIELEENSRISDAIEKAGGLKENANIKDINLACMLEDGMKVYIPSIEDINNKQENIDNNAENSFVKSGSNENSKDNVSNSSKNKNIKININIATQMELENLPGIGKSIAEKIINYRKENGKFKAIEDIKKVSGIGDAKYKQIKDLIDIK